MKQDRTISGEPLGYVSSGRFAADIARDSALRHREIARFCFRNGLRWEGKQSMHDAIREWRNFRFYKARIIQ